MNIDFSNLSANQIYHVITQTLIPRPIAWVLTESTKDNHNLAPFSYFSAVCSEPAVLMLSIGQKPTGEEKDTFTNLVTNRYAVVHISSDDQYQAVTKSAASLPHGESEIDAGQLATAEFENFPLPRLSDCDIAFGCELFQTERVKGSKQNLVLLKVTQVFINDEVVELDDKGRPKVHANKVKPLARLGANEYADFGEIISMARPK